jgi:hypothetical protein
MRHDPIEFGRVGLAARAAEDRVTRIATRLARGVAAGASTSDVEAIDEAFAGFTQIGMRVTRVDQGQSALPATTEDKLAADASGCNYEPFQRSIAEGLAAQLDALDRQRDRLAKLLQSIEANSLAR